MPSGRRQSPAGTILLFAGRMTLIIRAVDGSTELEGRQLHTVWKWQRKRAVYSVKFVLFWTRYIIGTGAAMKCLRRVRRSTSHTLRAARVCYSSSLRCCFNTHVTHARLSTGLTSSASFWWPMSWSSRCRLDMVFPAKPQEGQYRRLLLIHNILEQLLLPSFFCYSSEASF